MDVFELFAKVNLDTDNYNKSLDEASSKGDSFASKLGKGLGTAAKIGGAAIAAAGAVIVGVGKKALESYANYEQLVGGVDTLFKDSSATVQGYASQAFITAGLSANEYMETVTSFSASLLQGLGGDTAAAAEKANTALIDMSDNANKMGTSMESIQNAYQGFAKQNYTMLDNLKLGYGGTKSEMERLLADAQAISGIEYNVDSYADVVDALHVIQTEMGIAGTTALEASTTIQGSVGMLKGAWQNLLTGLADGNADVGALASDVISSISTVAENILPVIVDMLPQISTGLVQLVDGVIAMLPGLIETVVPSLVSGATDLVITIVKTLATNAPMLLQTGIDALLEIATGLGDAIPELIPVMVDAILQIVDTLTDPDNLMNLLDAALEIIIALAEGLIEALPKLLEKAPEIIINLVTAIIKAVPKLLEAAWEIIKTLAQGIADKFEDLKAKGKEIIDQVKNGIMEKIEQAKTWGKDLIKNFIDGILAKWEALKATVRNVAQSVKNFLGFSEPEEGPLSNFSTYAPDMMDLFAQGIRENEHVVTGQIAKSFDFGTQTVDFASSGLAKSSAGIMTGIMDSSGQTGSGGPITVDLKIDGTTLASLLLDPLNKVAIQRGVSYA